MKKSIGSAIKKIPNKAYPLITVSGLAFLFLILFLLFIFPLIRSNGKKIREIDSHHTMLKRYTTLKDTQSTLPPGTSKKITDIYAAIQPDTTSYLKLINDRLIEHAPVQNLSFVSIDFDQGKMDSFTKKTGQEFKVASLELTVSGTYESIGKYLMALEDLPLSYSIFSMKLGPSHANKVRMDLVLYFYLV